MPFPEFQDHNDCQDHHECIHAQVEENEVIIALQQINGEVIQRMDQCRYTDCKDR